MKILFVALFYWNVRMSFEKRNSRMHKALIFSLRNVLSFILLLFKVFWLPFVANNSNPLWHGVDHDDYNASHDDYGQKKVDASLKLGLWHKKHWVEEIHDIQVTGRQCCACYEDERQKSDPCILCFSTIHDERCADCKCNSRKQLVCCPKHWPDSSDTASVDKICPCGDNEKTSYKVARKPISFSKRFVNLANHFL